LTRSDRTEESLKKNSKKPFSVLGDMENLRFIFLDKKELPSEYSERERIKIEYFLEIVDNLWDAISKEMGDEPFKVAMEGLSFSSNGNSLVDIAMATALLRERIINKIGVENFHVFSPTSIKKFAVKGNAKKDELYYALVDLKEEGTNMNELTQVLAENQEEWITPKKVVNKPVDDIVDATWILLFLKNNLK
jgi:Holliday junction resolvasome RuvABC endonuclease subunit